MIRPIKYLFLCVFPLAGLLASCDDDESTYSYDANLISMIVADNINLSKLNTAATRTGIYDLLLESGPYTLLAPSDAAFGLSGTDPSSAGQTRLTKVISYHVLNGIYELDKLPFLFNQEITSQDGGKLFVTHWVRNQDTITTVNGAPISTYKMRASNGNIQVIDRLLEPYEFDYLSDAISNETELTLFNQALQKTDLLGQLSKEGAYTVYAPNNAAMITYGLSTIESINGKSKDELEKLLRYHIVPDRRFVYDYILTTLAGNVTAETMVNGDNVAVTLIPDANVPGTFKGITLLGTNNTKAINLKRENILTGNGVLHIIDNVLLN
ncbi:fasciclin domain-containing protein [Dysgonomonas sp. BGC7]|uniref:fasciclin domain-containing protein n=1 Tax=Dysgonomonas sp. BGC7 TaxID=1658008 RepID=UPI000AD721FB|nr:fasciclin domain-containing protein [Dysgonomonas sp. BGC7]MBD8387755.1 fasciclin domain-containing protein [Dysgonomonas sp. BGC7]